ncbi:hypothetical protein CMUS01_13404 [Colletotrichum musicola]|uniref:Uncharacterized protein n=1 Tax=Colletotrichum musicola TaxID=2175873 RepID=A0A8H6JDL0_9PEZI|nr:hypothetical protein CMUS01_13404 [Colletotrichum musicola]
MVHFSLVSLSLLSAASLAAASPTAPTVQRDLTPENFSWERWAESLIADPATALSVDEAVAVANQTLSLREGGQGEKRQEDTVRCNDGKPVASAPDAAWCIDYLAAKNTDCVTTFATAMCTRGNAQIVGNSNGNRAATNCNNVARTAGKIMDRCWRADNTVEGAMVAYNQPVMWVFISGPTI